MNPINRRDFLKKTGTAAIGAAGLTILRGNQAVAQNDTIGVGVAGINGRGQGHIKEFCGIEGVRVVALCDPDSRIFESRSKIVEDSQGHTPTCYQDVREMLDDDEIDAVSIATCNHWHSLITVWACQAGKDVYVEKPISHNIFEGRKAVEAARKYDRIVQGGHQSRSSGGTRDAVARVQAGQLGGPCFMARGLCYKPRGSIGFKEHKDAPETLDFDLWLGPAPDQPYHENIVHYNWHWFWDFGNGDLGNQGVHQMDIARWGLGKGLPVRVQSMGGRLGYEDQGETPNTQMVTMQYEDGTVLAFEVRGLPTNDEGGTRTGSKVANLFYGPDGWMSSTDGYTAHIGYDEKGEAAEDLDLPPQPGTGTGSHFQNFIDAVRSRNPEDLNCEIEEAHLSAACCHLANIAYRVGETLEFDPEEEKFGGEYAKEANKLLGRDYRKPFVVPDRV